MTNPETGTENTESNAQIAQNDADSSTLANNPKPNAAAGSKKAGNKNALCHGVFSNEVTLPWESPEDFDKLHAGFVEEWKPNGQSEEQAVLELTNYTWILWRAAKMAQLRFHRAPFGTQLLKSGNPSWQDLLEHEQQLTQTAESAIGGVDEMLQKFNELLDVVRSRRDSTKTSDGKAAQLELSRLSSEVSETISLSKQMDEVIRRLASIPVNAWHLLDKAYEPEVIEQQVKVLAAIAVRTDKAISRIIMLKEYKRVAALQSPPPRLIASPSVAPAESAPEAKSD
jgi:hypothetical protein